MPIVKIARVKSTAKDDLAILYLLVFELEGKELVKIGITTRNIEDRVTEILLAIFKKYRVFPYCRPKRFRKTTDVLKKEAELHRQFADRRYNFSKKFGGSTEFFDVPLDEVVTAYELLLNGPDKENDTTSEDCTA